MASTCFRCLNRSSLSSFRSHFSKANVAPRPHAPTKSFTAGFARTATGVDVGAASLSPIRLFRSLSRAPVELGSCSGSMYPLHSAVAAARLTSRLSFTSRSCRDISQGVYCPLHKMPDIDKAYGSLKLPST